jgi:hypothetical protein
MLASKHAYATYLPHAYTLSTEQPEAVGNHKKRNNHNCGRRGVKSLTRLNLCEKPGVVFRRHTARSGIRAVQLKGE